MLTQDRRRSIAPASIVPETEIGHLDGIFGDVLRGWFSSHQADSPELVLLVNGEVHTAIEPFRCEHERHDVATAHGVDAKCGFRLSLPVVHRDKVSEIKILHRESGFDFNGHTLRYCPAIDENKEKLTRLFHAEFYRFRYGHGTLSNREALKHYLCSGIFDHLDPNPWFSCAYADQQLKSLGRDSDIPIIGYLAHESISFISPSSTFDTHFYANENPDVVKFFGYLEHYVLHGHAEGRARLPTTLPEPVCHELLELSAFDHDLEHAIDFVGRVVRYPNLMPQTYIPALFKRRFPEPLAAVVCVNSLNLGGAELIATYVMKALAEHYGSENVLMIVTDSTDVSLKPMLNTDANVVFLDEEGRVAGVADRIDLLHAVIGQLKPERIININSRTAWGMYHAYGKQLSRFTELDANLFCFDFEANGRVFGYIREFIPGCLRYLTHVMCDNQQIIDDIRTHYGFAECDMAKFHTVYVPSSSGIATVDIDQVASKNKPILWSGRLANQKRPELLLAIAKAMPDLEFVVYGPPGDSELSDTIINTRFANIDYRGIYSDISDVDLSEFSVYLNTSAWEGLPTMIIQIMSAGLPVVTSNVGGIGELVDETSGWIVSEGGEVEAYISRINAVYSQAEQARQRAREGQSIVAERHSVHAYKQRLKDIGLLRKKNRLVSANVFDFTRRLFRRVS